LTTAAGAGAARIHGTRHHDFIQSVNGRRDVVSCGRGRDVATVDAKDRVKRDCEVVTREISQDPFRSSTSQHATEVEPDTASWGSTVVAVFQVGRIADGGAANIGWATSRNGGRTWNHGFLPGLTPASKPAGSWPRISDPSVAYDARHRVWLAVSLAFGSSDSANLISRSSDGLHWSRPVTATLRRGFQLDKEWIACDTWQSSPFFGHCYLSYDDLETLEIETQVSADGGLTWAAPAHAPGFPGRAAIQGKYAPGVQPVVRPDGMVVIPYFDEDLISELRSLDGGATWLPPTPIYAPQAYYAPIPGLRAGPLPSAAVDGAGTVYVAWADSCAPPNFCGGPNQIFVARSSDGVSWTPPKTTSRPTLSSDVELPGLAADPNTPGSLVVTYYNVVQKVALNVYLVSSRNGGATWSAPRRLNSRTFPFDWLAEAGGAMVGDYISTSFAAGRAVPVFAVGIRPRGGRLHESMFATSLAVPH
jgi:hypothetical protein